MDGLCQMIMQNEGTGKKSLHQYAFSLTLKGTKLSVLVTYLTCVGYVLNQANKNTLFSIHVQNLDNIEQYLNFQFPA